MDELQKLIEEQKKDMHCFKISFRSRLIRPFVYRFPCFAGNTPREKAYSVLRYLGWKTIDINHALKANLNEFTSLKFDFNTVIKPENYDRFFIDIPAESPRDKAILVLRGMYWNEKDIASALKISRRTVTRISKILRT